MIDIFKVVVNLLTEVLFYVGWIAGLSVLIMYLLNYIKKSTKSGYYFFYFLRYRKYIIKWLKDNRKVD